MGSIRREAILDVPARDVWAGLREVGKAAEMFPGILTACELRRDDERVVTFANGLVVVERIIGVDDQNRRMAYSAQVDGFAHHNASMEVLPLADNMSRFIWITDFLPDDARSFAEPLIEEGIRCFEQRWKQEARV